MSSLLDSRSVSSVPADTLASHDVEIWWSDGSENAAPAAGYWWRSFSDPNRLVPDGPPVGPFATKSEALADAQGGGE